jgi:hypothetical protein
MARALTGRRIAKLVSAIAVCFGIVAAFLGATAGASMGAPFLTGERGRDAFVVIFSILPVFSAAVFIWATLRERSRPEIAAWLYVLAVALIGVQVAMPAIF